MRKNFNIKVILLVTPLSPVPRVNTKVGVTDLFNGSITSSTYETYVYDFTVF